MRGVAGGLGKDVTPLVSFWPARGRKDRELHVDVELGARVEARLWLTAGGSNAVLGGDWYIALARAARSAGAVRRDRR